MATKINVDKFILSKLQTKKLRSKIFKITLHGKNPKIHELKIEEIGPVKIGKTFTEKTTTYATHYKRKNCQIAPMSWNDKLELVDVAKLVWEFSISTELASKCGSFKERVYLPKIGILPANAKTDLKEKTSISKATKINERNFEDVQINVAPKSETTVTLQKTVKSKIYPFKINVVIRGNFDADYEDVRKRSKKLKTIEFRKPISDYLSKKERTFQLEGTISKPGKASLLNIITAERPSNC